MLGELELAAIVGPLSGWVPVFLPATATALVAGVGVRLGPGRAFWLAMRSRFGSVRGLGDMPGSQRVGDVTALREGLANLQTNAYIVVSGPKGVGKSCAIATATKSMPSVVSIDVAQGTKQEVIVESGLRAITRDSMQFINPLPNAERVLKWHNFFLAPPVLVVNVSERARQRHLRADDGRRACAHQNGHPRRRGRIGQLPGEGHDQHETRALAGDGRDVT